MKDTTRFIDYQVVYQTEDGQEMIWSYDHDTELSGPELIDTLYAHLEEEGTPGPLGIIAIRQDGKEIWSAREGYNA